MTIYPNFERTEKEEVLEYSTNIRIKRNDMWYIFPLKINTKITKDPVIIEQFINHFHINCYKILTLFKEGNKWLDINQEEEKERLLNIQL